MVELIFICTVGGSPAVATETLWSLINDSKPARIPSRIEIITTMVSLQWVSQALQSPGGIMSSLFKSVVPPVVIYVPRSRDGFELEPLVVEWPGGTAPAPQVPQFADSHGLADIVNEFDARIMGDLIKDRVWAAANPKRNGPETEIHISIAGGRKTMSAHALLSLALVGRTQDEASHVLVSPEFENHPGFWHKDQGGLLNTKEELGAFRDRKELLPPPSLDPASAAITLIRTPTPMVSELDAKRAKLGTLKLSTIMRQIDIANRYRRAPELKLECLGNTVVLCGIEGKLNAVPFAQLRFLAFARMQTQSGDVEMPSQPVGSVTSSWLKEGGGRQFEPVRKMIAFLEAAWSVQRPNDSLDELRAESERTPRSAAARHNKRTKEIVPRDGPLYFAVKLLEKLNEPNRTAEDEWFILDGVRSWLGSGTELMENLETVFGLPVAALLLRKSGKRGANWAIGLTCPVSSIKC